MGYITAGWSVFIHLAGFFLVQVNGDTLRWSEVFANVDVTVRYIHDIMKVDVILKREFMRDLRAVVSDGSLSREAFLTARFDIDLVEINSEARQGGSARDVYAPSLALDTPLEFVQGDKVVHRLRPVTVYALDNAGNEIVETASAVRTSQVWQLRRNASGMAEMSAEVGGLVDLPDGDVVIDPSETFSDSEVKDALLDNENKTTNYGSSTSLLWEENDRLVFGFDVGPELGVGRVINSASMQVYVWVNDLTNDTKAHAHRLSQNWVESEVTYNNRTSAAAWSTAGGTIAAPTSSPLIIPAGPTGFIVDFDITDPFRVQYEMDEDDPFDLGYLIKFAEDIPNDDFLKVRSRDYTTASQRPKLIVTFDHTRFGADGGNATSTSPNEDTRLQAVSGDHFDIIRFFVGSQSSIDVEDFVDKANTRKMKVLLVFGKVTESSKEDYRDNVVNMLNELSDHIDGTESRAIFGVELGNEEEGNSKWGNISDDPTTRFNSGADFAEYYLESRTAIIANLPHLLIVGGGSVFDHKTLPFPDVAGHQEGIGQKARAFVSGFIAKVTTSGSVSALPDIIAIHGYTDPLPPEDLHQNNGGSKTYILRNDHIKLAIDRVSGYSPAIAVTEYGFLNDATFDEKAQAVYYLRRALINGTAITATGNKHWNYSLYFHHPTSDTDFGMSETTANSPRSIRRVAAALHSPQSATPGLGTLGSSIWIAAATTSESLMIASAMEDEFQPYKDATVICGWFNALGKRWGAIWRFNSSEDEGFDDLSPDTRKFVAPGNTESLSAQRYQFEFGSPPSFANTALAEIGSPISGTYNSGNNETEYSIPSVGGNPVLLLFE